MKSDKKKSVFETLSAINVNEHKEKKGKMTFLSWAWAWNEVKKLYPEMTTTVYENTEGLNYHHDGKTAWVKTGVTIEGQEYIEYLPIMDFHNSSIPIELLSSTDDVPSTTIPSAGTLSPVRTLTILPTGILDDGTMTMLPVLLSTIFAYSGRRDIISPSARRAFVVARASNHSDTANRNETDAASSNSPNASAPKAAITIMQLASN